MQLVEEATEGCWIGHRARMFTSEIGSVYSPPDRQPYQPAAAQPTETPKHVETVIDIGHNKEVRSIALSFEFQAVTFVRDGYTNARKVAFAEFS